MMEKKKKEKSQRWVGRDGRLKSVVRGEIGKGRIFSNYTELKKEVKHSRKKNKKIWRSDIQLKEFYKKFLK